MLGQYIGRRRHSRYMGGINMTLLIKATTGYFPICYHIRYIPAIHQIQHTTIVKMIGRCTIYLSIDNKHFMTQRRRIIFVNSRRVTLNQNADNITLLIKSQPSTIITQISNIVDKKPCPIIRNYQSCIIKQKVAISVPQGGLTTK